MPKELSFDESLRRIKFLFRMTGLNVDPGKRKFKQNCVFLLNLQWICSDMFSCFQWIIRGLLTGHDFIEITFVAPCATLSILGVIKGLLIMFNEKEMHNVVIKLRELEAIKDEFNSVDEDEVIRPEIKFLEVVIKVLNVLNCLMVAVFDLTPLVLMVVKYYRTGKLELMLPFFDVYPFDALDLRFWPFIYMHQIWSECIVLLKICATDYFFFICCTHIRIQFKLLQRHFEEIIPNNSSPTAIDYLSHNELKNKFIKLIKWHQQIISATYLLEEMYSKSTLYNFCISSFVICLTGFNLATINNIAFQMTSLTFLFMSLLQILFLCLFGDIMMRSSIEVGDSVYNSRWYSSDATTGRIVLMIQTRAHKPCKLTAAGFADVNLNAFMKILSTSWSYFALLRTIYGSLK